MRTISYVHKRTYLSVHYTYKYSLIYKHWRGNSTENVHFSEHGERLFPINRTKQFVLFSKNNITWNNKKITYLYSYLCVFVLEQFLFVSLFACFWSVQEAPFFFVFFLDNKLKNQVYDDWKTGPSSLMSHGVVCRFIVNRYHVLSG